MGDCGAVRARARRHSSASSSSATRIFDSRSRTPRASRARPRRTAATTSSSTSPSSKSSRSATRSSSTRKCSTTGTARAASTSTKLRDAAHGAARDRLAGRATGPQSARLTRRRFSSCRRTPPSSSDACARGPRTRGNEQRRLRDSLGDMTHWDEFDHLIVNDDFDAALARLAAVIAGGIAAIGPRCPRSEPRRRRLSGAAEGLRIGRAGGLQYTDQPCAQGGQPGWPASP